MVPQPPYEARRGLGRCPALLHLSVALLTALTLSLATPASAAPPELATPLPPPVIALPAYAETAGPAGVHVCGEIASDTVWSEAAAAYTVTCDVHVTPGARLTIEPGVTVRFQQATLDLIVSGTLRAEGRPTAPVVFQPSAGTGPGSWGRLAFLPGSSGLLNHVTLEYGGSEDGMLYVASEQVEVLNSVVRGSADTGIVIRTPARGSRWLSPRSDHRLFLPVVLLRWTRGTLHGGPVIRDTQVVSNTGRLGGGLYNEAGSPTLEGVSFRGNMASGEPWDRPGLGAGLYNASGNPVIRNSTFASNGKSGEYAFGAGLYNDSGSPLIEGNTFSGNAAGYGASGGGLFTRSGSPIIVKNTFSDNTAEQDGGGLHNESGSPVVRDNVFTHNIASGRSAYGYGGGLSNRSGAPVIEGNLFEGNEIYGRYGPGYGAGLYTGGPALIRSNTFRGNSATGYGGGLHTVGAGVSVENNIFSGNTGYDGGGLSAGWESPAIRNNVFFGNVALYQGGAILVTLSSPDIRNNILAGNKATGGGGGGVVVVSGSPVADYNAAWDNSGGDYAGLAPGLHSLAADPRFVDAAGGDFHLAAGSACIDAGDPANFASRDFEGDARPQGPAPDIGADEFVADPASPS